MRLTKRVPTHNKTIELLWCKKNFLPMGPEFREARKNIGRSKMCSCFWCGHKFDDGEMMALACPKKGANRILCQSCADELLNAA